MYEEYLNKELEKKTPEEIEKMTKQEKEEHYGEAIKKENGVKP